jgi:hypothetical protein
MTALHLQLPDSLHKQLLELAAVAEKLAALRTVKYLEERAKLGNRAAFEEVLAKVPDVEPEPQDRLP